MVDKKILYISSEVVPYLPESELSITSFSIPKMVNERGGQTRIFIPKYGVINERRHQLHEVIRLSGMNLLINDIDMPLIIKVASIPKERMQVYFIDNEEYFKGRGLFQKEGKLFEDNEERAVFFAKGVIETVKKLNWSPDIIHAHGWIASLVPLYCKEYYKDEPLLANTKVVTSFYEPEFDGNLRGDFVKKIAFDGIDKNKLDALKKPSHTALMKIAVEHSDGVIIASAKINNELRETISISNKPVLSSSQVSDSLDAYEDFYQNKI